MSPVKSTTISYTRICYKVNTGSAREEKEFSEKVLQLSPPARVKPHSLADRKNTYRRLVLNQCRQVGAA